MSTNYEPNLLVGDYVNFMGNETEEEKENLIAEMEGEGMLYMSESGFLGFVIMEEGDSDVESVLFEIKEKKELFQRITGITPVVACYNFIY